MMDAPFKALIPFSFHSEVWLLHHVKDDVNGVLAIVFKWYTPAEYKADLQQWLHAAITNPKNIYDDGVRRSNLVTLHTALSVLVDTMHLLHEKGGSVLHTDTISRFCRTYPWPHVKMELWDWLDAGIANDQVYHTGMDRSYLLLTYQCVKCMAEAAYIIAGRQPLAGEAIFKPPA